MSRAGTILECENHFKTDESTAKKKQFISKWIEIINNTEKNISLKMTN